MEVRYRYPIGLQTFSELRERGYLYIDKTEYIWRMTHSEYKYVFLSRPRRFGKSLLTSTLKCYFEGRKDLFKGLAIEGLETEWEKYPVLHFDMSTAKHQSKEDLEQELSLKLTRLEQIYGKGEGESRVNNRLEGLILRAYKQTGKKVVVLIDEYDSPLLDIVHEEQNLPELRSVMRNFYSPLKACDPYLRFVFMTGITKFSQLSIFSELNNIKNISMLEEYATVCGISKEELMGQLTEDVDMLAKRMGVTHEEALGKLIENYDGYHFTWPSPDIFNPYSLLNAFSDGKIDDYWFGTGTPTYIVEMLRKFGIAPTEIGGISCRKDSFDAPTERMQTAIPLLYQSGYLTIKDYNRITDRYTLDIPNKEVRIGLMDNLIDNYVRQPDTVRNLVADMYEMLYYENLEGALEIMQKVFGSLPYCNDCNKEGHYQQLLALVFILMGHYIDVEVHTPAGRVDAVLKTKTKLYILELKLDSSPEEALSQIDLKNYSQRFALCSLPIVKVGINFDSKTRTVSDWKIG